MMLKPSFGTGGAGAVAVGRGMAARLSHFLRRASQPGASPKLRFPAADRLAFAGSVKSLPAPAALIVVRPAAPRRPTGDAG
jgi:hypothetical protein